MEIQPDKQNLDQTFSTTVYFIDFYQRDYKWTEEPVRRLLDDVFYLLLHIYAVKIHGYSKRLIVNSLGKE